MDPMDGMDPMETMEAIDAMERQEWDAHCPYCGEPLTLLLDPMEANVDYVEDCQVCCRPMVVSVLVDGDGDLAAQVRAEDE